MEPLGGFIFSRAVSSGASVSGEEEALLAALPRKVSLKKSEAWTWSAARRACERFLRKAYPWGWRWHVLPLLPPFAVTLFCCYAVCDWVGLSGREILILAAWCCIMTAVAILCWITLRLLRSDRLVYVRRGQKLLFVVIPLCGLLYFLSDAWIALLPPLHVALVEGMLLLPVFAGCHMGAPSSEVAALRRSMKASAEEAAQAGVLTKDILINEGYSNEQTRMFEWGDSGMNANLITIMEGYEDPRLPLYVTMNQADVTCEDGSTIPANTRYLGVRGGCNLPAKPNQWGNFSKIVCSYTTAFPIMKAAEGYFLRAEGILRGWNMGGGTAQQWYEEGIRTSIRNEAAYKGIEVLAGVTSVSDEEIENYINGTTLQEDFVDPVDKQNNIEAQNDVCVKWDDSASNEKKLQRIMIQKWIANFPISCEGWAEYRRTGYPKFFPNRVNLSNGTIDTDEQVRRLLYSDNEINTNNVELQNGINLLNEENSSSQFSGDIGGTRVWWDRANVGNF